MPAWTLRRPFIVFLMVLNLVFIGALLWLAPKAVRVRALPSETGPATLPSIGAFQLIRESGEPFSSDDLKTGPWVADFIFTRCAGQCPLMSTRFAVLQKNLPASARLVSFSVDSAYDTPAILKEYAARFGARPEQWVFLTGDPLIIRQIQARLNIWSGDDPGMHSLRLILMDKEGGARGYYDSDDPKALARLQKDLKALAEKR